MKVKTQVRAGKLAANHCPIVRCYTPMDSLEMAMKIKTNVRAGFTDFQFVRTIDKPSPTLITGK